MLQSENNFDPVEEVLALVVEEVSRRQVDHQPNHEVCGDAPARAKADGDPVPFALAGPENPMAVARQLLEPNYDATTGVPMLRNWRGSWMRWSGAAWSEVDESEIRANIYHQLEHATYESDRGMRRWAPNRAKVANVLDAMAMVTLLPVDIQPPAWVGTAGPPSVIACTNGLLDLASRALHPHDPRFFNLVAVPFQFDPAASEPGAWLEFLESVWPEKPENIDLLQEWFGYVLSGRIDLDKMMLLLGPPRSGKGTIATILSDLVGKENVAGPTLARLSDNFGLADLIHKPLAIIPDARVGRNSSGVVERLLAITGEDRLNVERKYLADWSGQLPTRLMMLTNELPELRDASGALANRFLILQMTESFLGREDTDLRQRLSQELPAILNWALAGLDRLSQRGRFTEPRSSKEAIITLMDTASPVSAFVREQCRVEPAAEALVDDVWSAWTVWALDNGHRPGNKQTLGKRLTAVVPGLKVERPWIEGVRARQYRGLALRPTGHAVEATADRRGPAVCGPQWSADHRDAGSTRPALQNAGSEWDASSEPIEACTSCGKLTWYRDDDRQPLCIGCTEERP